MRKVFKHFISYRSIALTEVDSSIINNRGISLIEVVVTVGLMSIAAMGAVTFGSTILHSTRVTTNVAEANTFLRMAITDARYKKMCAKITYDASSATFSSTFFDGPDDCSAMNVLIKTDNFQFDPNITIVGVSLSNPIVVDKSGMLENQVDREIAFLAGDSGYQKTLKIFGMTGKITLK